jgi:hypothetical protein
MSVFAKNPAEEQEKIYLLTFIGLLYTKDESLKTFITEINNVVNVIDIEELENIVYQNYEFKSNRVTNLQNGGVNANYTIFIFIIFLYSMMRINAAFMTISKIQLSNQIKTDNTNALQKYLDQMNEVKNIIETPAELVKKIKEINDDSVNFVEQITESLETKKINMDHIKSVIDVVSDLNLINHDFFNVIKHGKDANQHLTAIYKKEYDFKVANIINTIDTFCELGQLSIKYLAKHLATDNIFSKILEINQTGHYIIASQILWNINRHTLKEALSFSPIQRTEFMDNPDTYPTLFHDKDIKKFINKNKKALNTIIIKTQQFIQDEIKKNNNNFPELANIVLLGGSKKRKTKTRSKRRLNRYSKHRSTRR